ncbi:MAG: hypothetical protein Kow0075_15990 [Salibacteraceae bacterium]
MLNFALVNRQLFFVLLFFPLTALAVNDTTQSDSTIPPKPKVRALSNVIFQFDNRNEKYFDTRARMNGLKIGLELFKRVRLGYGFYGNNQFYPLTLPGLESQNQALSTRLSYFTFFTEVVWFRNFRWEVSTSHAIGRGVVNARYYDVSTSIPVLDYELAIPDNRITDLALQAQYKIISWFGIGAGVGRRWLRSDAEPAFNEPFSLPYFDFKLKLYLGYLIKSIFKPEVIRMERAWYDYRKTKRQETINNWINGS